MDVKRDTPVSTSMYKNCIFLAFNFLKRWSTVQQHPDGGFNHSTKIHVYIYTKDRRREG